MSNISAAARSLSSDNLRLRLIAALVLPSLIHGEIINQRDNKTQNTHCGYHADDIPEQEPDYIADCFDGDWQMFEDNYGFLVHGIPPDR